MMTLHSSSFGDGQEIPQKYGGKGRNVSPELSWEDAPEGTESFALAMVDTDPVARGYVHWLVADIPPQTTELPEGSVPAEASQVSPYVGPTPPAGTHVYELTVYALDTPHLDLPRDADPADFGVAVAEHTIESARLVGTFTRA